MTDGELRTFMSESVRKGHQALFDEYCNYVYAVVINVLRGSGSREDIEECVSDAFAKIFRSYDVKGCFEGNLKGYIGAVAKRTAIDAYRRLSSKNYRTMSIDDENVGQMQSEENIERNAERSEQQQIILRIIKDLGEPDSTIIIHQYYYDRTAKEIAEILNMTPAAVQKRSSRARQKLKKLLTEAGIGREAEL